MPAVLLDALGLILDEMQILCTPLRTATILILDFEMKFLGVLLLAWTDPIDQPLDGNGLAIFHKLGR